MIIKYNIEIQKDTIQVALKKIINQTYKLLPMRQENKDWVKPLQTILQELSGMKRLQVGQQDLFFLILCKMEGLFSLTRQEDMELYRRIVFECLSLLNNLKQNVELSE